jgi:hypothetical protein
MTPFSELSGKEKTIELIRWLLVPCVGVLIGLVNSRLITDLLTPLSRIERMLTLN